MDVLMVKEPYYIQMEINMQVNSNMANKRDWVNQSIRMGMYLKDSGTKV